MLQKPKMKQENISFKLQFFLRMSSFLHTNFFHIALCEESGYESDGTAVGDLERFLIVGMLVTLETFLTSLS